MEKILLFQCQEEVAQIKQIAATMKIKVQVIEKEFFRETIENLEKGKPSAPKERFDGNPPEESLMVFCNVSEKHFDRMLAEMKKKQISVGLKAAMTPTNRNWSVLRLYLELEKEKKRYL